MQELKTVNDMYNYSKLHNLPLLSNYGSTFWQSYISNFTRYDKLFNRMFLNFTYFLQNTNESAETVTNNFIDDVYSHLFINDKKYAELYRINVIDDNSFSIVDNYNLTETMDKEINHSGTETDGTRTDNIISSIGNQSITETNTIAGFNSSSFSNDNKVDSIYGNREDSRNNIKGEQTNTNSFEDSEEYVLTRKGNIGIKTAQAIIGEQKRLWSEWEFYEYIFREISAELLMV